MLALVKASGFFISPLFPVENVLWIFTYYPVIQVPFGLQEA
jgi:hypothetical protein